MCFGQKTPQATTPAAAPAPPEQTADETSPTDARKEEDTNKFGPDGQNLRVDRSATSGGAAAGGAGLRM